MCVYFSNFTYSIPFSKNISHQTGWCFFRIQQIIVAKVLSSTDKPIWVVLDQCIGFFYSSWKARELIDSRSLQSGPPNDVMLQSQLNPSHCCRHTPWLEQESSWQVVLGPEETDDRVEREKQTDRKKKRRVYKFTSPLQHKNPE